MWVTVRGGRDRTAVAAAAGGGEGGGKSRDLVISHRSRFVIDQ